MSQSVSETERAIGGINQNFQDHCEPDMEFETIKAACDYFRNFIESVEKSCYAELSEQAKLQITDVKNRLVCLVGPEEKKNSFHFHSKPEVVSNELDKIKQGCMPKNRHAIKEMYQNQDAEQPHQIRESSRSQKEQKPSCSSKHQKISESDTDFEREPRDKIHKSLSGQNKLKTKNNKLKNRNKSTSSSSARDSSSDSSSHSSSASTEEKNFRMLENFSKICFVSIFF